MEDPRDYDARAELMWIGTLAHNGLAGCGLGVPGMRDGDWTCHGMEHEMSAIDAKITHGAGLAVIFPAWRRHVWKSPPERLLAVGAGVVGIAPVTPALDDLSGIDEEITPERAERDAVEATIDELQDFFMSMGMATIDELQDFFMSMGMPSTLSELGIAEDDIDRMICGLRVTRGERFGTFRSLSLDDARAIYESAL